MSRNSNDEKRSFLEFFQTNKGNTYEWNVNFAEQRNNFIKDYPLSNIKNMKVEEYVLGTSKSKNSLSYKLEFGAYAKVGHGIGGNSANKFGVYASNNSYKNKDGIINDISSFWDEFKTQLYDYLIELGSFDTSIDFSKYPLLKGMSMVINKLAFLYYPERFVNIGKNKSVVTLLELFNYKFDKNLPTEQLSFVLNKNLRKDFPELNKEEPVTIGSVLWDYLFKITNKEIEKNLYSKKYWLFAPGENANLWDDFYKNGIIAIDWDELGDLSNYSTKNEIKESLISKYSEYQSGSSNKNIVLAIYEFYNEMQVGDVIYSKKGRSLILGRGIVESEYIYDVNKHKYKSYRKIKWTHNKTIDHKSIMGNMPIKSVTDISKYKDYVVKLEKLFDNESDLLSGYNRIDFLNDVFISGDFYDKIISALERKKNIVLQGTPGVGKTYCAKKLFYSLIGNKDESKVVTVQFHQSYSYEDFVQGYRPNDDGNFELKNGVFYDLVSEARSEYERAFANSEEAKKYCIIIDEINRGNLSKIFGELMMLVESDKRSKEWSLRLAYSDDLFYIPENLYIIGTMNTADRSLTTIDYALRRRFAFFTLTPAFDNEEFCNYLIDKNSLPKHFVTEIGKRFVELNEYIQSTLGENFVIGHSYFIDTIDPEVMESYNNIIEHEIRPLLEEYYFDDKDKIETAFNKVDFKAT